LYLFIFFIQGESGLNGRTYTMPRELDLIFFCIRGGVKMSSLIGMVTEFRADQEHWQIYSEKLEQYFRANKITDKAGQVATLLSLIGTST